MSPGKPRGEALTRSETNTLRGLLEARGERALADQLAIHPQTLARCIAGLNVNRSVAALVRAKLDEFRDMAAQ